MSGAVSTSAGMLSSTAARSEELTTMVAAASEQATTNVQSVASATEELTSSVNEISRQVQESVRMANEAVGQARRTNDRVAELSKAAARIGDVVELINSIAGQTNLLALNATTRETRWTGAPERRPLMGQPPASLNSERERRVFAPSPHNSSRAAPSRTIQARLWPQSVETHRVVANRNCGDRPRYRRTHPDRITRLRTVARIPDRRDCRPPIRRWRVRFFTIKDCIR
jgi:gas vesicle protein